MSAVKSASSKINWTKLSSAIAGRQQTQAALSNFRKEYEDAKRQLSVLQEQKTTVDFSQYRSVLKNQKVVDELEKTLKNFKPVTYNLAAQQTLISAYETKAIENAEATTAQIEKEISGLKETLTNIETARPVDQLSVEDVTSALPEIDAKLEEMLQQGTWTVPGYGEKFGSNPLF